MERRHAKPTRTQTRRIKLPPSSPPKIPLIFFSMKGWLIPTVYLVHIRYLTLK